MAHGYSASAVSTPKFAALASVGFSEDHAAPFGAAATSGGTAVWRA